MHACLAPSTWPRIICETAEWYVCALFLSHRHAMQGLLYLALCAAVCNDSTLGSSAGARHVGDSTDVALRIFSEAVGIPSAARVCSSRCGCRSVHVGSAQV